MTMIRTNRNIIGCLAAAAALLAAACDKNKEETATPADLDKPILSPADDEGETGDESYGLEGDPGSEGTDDDDGKPAAAVKEPEPLDQSTQAGIALLGSGDMSGARKSFKDALDANPKAYVAAYNLGVMAEKDGDLKNAKKYYSKSFNAKPGYGPPVAAYALIEYKETGSHKTALKFIEPKATKYPASYAMQAAYAKLLVDDGRLSKAMDVAKAVLKNDERNLDAMIALARAYLGNGQYEFATFIVNQAKDIDDRDPEVYMVLAGIALAENKKKLARTHLKKAVELDPYFLEARNNLAVLLLDGANFEEAAGHLEALAAVSEFNGEVFLNLGEAYRGMRKWKEAMKAYDTAEKLGVPKSMIYFNLAILYFSAESIEDMTRKEILRKSQSNFLKYRDEVGAKAASEEIDIDMYLKRIDKMIKIQEKLEAKKKDKEAEPAAGGGEDKKVEPAAGGGEEDDDEWQ
ncbi:MAG: tetratricopeptide repeat protein [Pseudomonadota bacterium]